MTGKEMYVQRLVPPPQPERVNIILSKEDSTKLRLCVFRYWKQLSVHQIGAPYDALADDLLLFMQEFDAAMEKAGVKLW